MHFIIQIIQSIVLLIIFNINCSCGETQKKELKNQNITVENDVNMSIKPISPDLNNNEEPESYMTGFVICMVIGLIAVILISCKAFNMRRSRAERRYGVQGDRSAQELTPLPIAIDDDESDIEDHTLFDRNRIT